MLPIHGVAAVDAGKSVGGQQGEDIAQRFGVEKSTAITEVEAGVVAVTAQGQDVVGGNEAVAFGVGQR